jgi:hypothetical protein
MIVLPPPSDNVGRTVRSGRRRRQLMPKMREGPSVLAGVERQNRGAAERLQAKERKACMYREKPCVCAWRLFSFSSKRAYVYQELSQHFPEPLRNLAIDMMGKRRPPREREIKGYIRIVEREKEHTVHVTERVRQRDVSYLTTPG